MRFLKRTYTLLLALALMLACAGVVRAAEVRILPATASAAVSNTVTLTVAVDQAADLGGFQFNYTFDPVVLGISSVAVNNAFDLPVKNQIDNLAGKGIVAASVYSSPTLSGTNVPLAVITFTVKAAGSSGVALANVILGKVGGEEILSTTAGAVVTSGPTHTITAIAGQHGSISPPDATLVAEGASQIYTIIPDPGYGVQTVTVDLVSQGSITTYTFTNVTVDHTITASFVDNIPPVGTITITGGSFYTKNPLVNLTLTCNDLGGSGCSQAEISNDSGFIPSTLYSIATSTNVSWTLTGADGVKTVYGRFTDVVGNSADTSRPIVLDRVAPVSLATPTGGTYPTAQSVTLSCVDTLTPCSVAYSTGSSTLTAANSITLNLSTSGTYTIFYQAFDAAGNFELPVKSVVYVIDLNAPQIKNVSPASGSFINTANVSYTLNKLMTTGSVVFTQISGTVDAGSPHVYTMIPADLTAGSHQVTPGNVNLVNGAVYSVAFSAADGPVSAPTVTSTNVTYDTSAVLITLTNPVSGGRTNLAAVSYILSEPTTSGSIVISDGFGQPIVYPVTGASLTAGAHTVSTGAALLNNAVYDFALTGFTDRAGNTASTVTASNVTFDTTAVVISNTTPTTKAIITAAQAGYTLSEQAASGTVTFTWSGGTPDPASPHVYTMQATDLAPGAHAGTLPLVLVRGAFYTVSFAATDIAGNTSTTVSNTLIYFDDTYDPTLPGNVDNTGASTGVVDNADVKVLEKSLGTRPGDQHWNPVCDLDRNNIIDARDLMILRSNQTVK